MRTEEQLIYQLLNIYHGGQISSDSAISERLMRDFLRKHRARKIEKYSIKGLTISDECFQSLGTVSLEFDKYYYTKKIPPLISLDYHGIMLTKAHYEIPVMDRSAFRASLKNMINKGFPKATMLADKLIVFPGELDECRFETGSTIHNVVKGFNDEILSFNDNPKITVELDAVLYDPSQAESYDWTKDPYPCPSEILDDITTSVTQKDLQLMIRQYVDDNINNRMDKQEPNEGV